MQSSYSVSTIQVGNSEHNVQSIVILTTKRQRNPSPSLDKLLKRQSNCDVLFRGQVILNPKKQDHMHIMGYVRLT